MMSSPTMAGWRTVWRQPALVAGEIVWRWIFGLIVALVLGFSFLVYLRAVHVPEPAVWLISTHQPMLMGTDLLYAIRPTGWIATKIALVALPSLAVFWLLMSSVGRAATLQPMFAHEKLNMRDNQRRLWPGLLGLNFLRFSLWFAAGIACGGALMLAFTWARGSRPAVLVVFVALSTIILSLWAVVNWLLSLATLFAVRDCSGTFEAISSAVDLACDCFPELLTTSSAWAAMRTAGLIATILVYVGVISSARHVSLVMGLLLVTLVYLGFSDLLSIGRLASYAAIIEAELEASPAPPSRTPEIPPALPVNQPSREMLG